MDVSGWLWNHWLSDGQRSYLMTQIQKDGKPSDEDLCENLIRFLGGIHDLGKATPAFNLSVLQIPKGCQ